MKKVHREGIANEILMDMRSAKKRQGDIHLQDIIGVDQEGNEVRVEDKIADDKDPVDDQVGLIVELSNLDAAILKELHGRERQVIEMRYGLGGQEELTQREIALALGISRSYVSRIEKKALARLTKRMEK